MVNRDVKGTIGFQPRCAACEEHRKVARGLKGKDVLADDIAEIDCEVRNCFHRRWWKTKFCPEHIRSIFQNRLFRPHLLPNATFVAQSLAECLANRWLFSKKSAGTALMQMFMEKHGGQRWVCLDIETVTNAVGSREIWQIGIVDYNTGDVLIDECLEHFCPSRCHCRAVVHRSPTVGPEVLGKMFAEKGINHCNVLVWCKTYYDMKYTRYIYRKLALAHCSR